MAVLSCLTVSINFSCTHDSAKVDTGMEAPRIKQPTTRPPRLCYIDWIRALIIALVVAFHSIDLYFDYTYSTAVYLGIVSAGSEGYARQVAIVFAQLMQVGGTHWQGAAGIQHRRCQATLMARSCLC